jgi:hypothetical protein
MAAVLAPSQILPSSATCSSVTSEDGHDDFIRVKNVATNALPTGEKKHEKSIESQSKVTNEKSIPTPSLADRLSDLAVPRDVFPTKDAVDVIDKINEILTNELIPQANTCMERADKMSPDLNAVEKSTVVDLRKAISGIQTTSAEISRLMKYLMNKTTGLGDEKNPRRELSSLIINAQELHEKIGKAQLQLNDVERDIEISRAANRFQKACAALDKIRANTFNK